LFGGTRKSIIRCIVEHLQLAKKPARRIRWDVAGANVVHKECAQPIMIASVILYECCVAAETVLGMCKCSATSARGFA
jgi:hypothetical protein